MANLYVTEFNSIAGSGDAPVVIPGSLIRTQSVAISGTSAATSNAMGTDARFIRIYTDTACHIVFGASPTATTDDMPLGAFTEFWYALPPSGSVKVAVISAA